MITEPGQTARSPVEPGLTSTGSLDGLTRQAEERKKLRDASLTERMHPEVIFNYCWIGALLLRESGRPEHRFL
jgi:hypothetical protein